VKFFIELRPLNLLRLFDYAAPLDGRPDLRITVVLYSLLRMDLLDVDHYVLEVLVDLLALPRLYKGRRLRNLNRTPDDCRLQFAIVATQFIRVDEHVGLELRIENAVELNSFLSNDFVGADQVCGILDHQTDHPILELR